MRMLQLGAMATKQTHCRLCGRELAGENLRIDPTRQTQSCVACRRTSRERSEYRKSLGLPPLNGRKPKKEPSAPAVDHSKCDPENPASMCGNCRSMLVAAEAHSR